MSILVITLLIKSVLITSICDHWQCLQTTFGIVSSHGETKALYACFGNGQVVSKKECVDSKIVTSEDNHANSNNVSLANLVDKAVCLNFMVNISK